MIVPVRFNIKSKAVTEIGSTSGVLERLGVDVWGVVEGRGYT